MANKFDMAMDFIIVAEGGYVDNMRDLGGETKYGISKRSYPHIDIRGLTVGRAKDIYHIDFWIPAGCDNLSWPLALAQMDAAVNHGVTRANEILRNLLRRGDLEENQFDRYMESRRAIYESMPDAQKHAFLKGWLNRLENLKRYVEEHKGGQVDE